VSVRGYCFFLVCLVSVGSAYCDCYVWFSVILVLMGCYTFFYGIRCLLVLCAWERVSVLFWIWGEVFPRCFR
jgi:hypothetical protein